jgi:hypothetical protein
MNFTRVFLSSSILFICSFVLFPAKIQAQAVCTTDGATCTRESGALGVCVSGMCVEAIVGCQDINACNYDSDPTVNVPGICLYEDISSCLICDSATKTLIHSDADEDGTCDQFEIRGSNNANACNFRPGATEIMPPQLKPNDGCGICGVYAINDQNINLAGYFKINAGEDLYEAEFIAKEEYENLQTDNSEPEIYWQHPLYIAIDLDTDDDGVCDSNEEIGCIDPMACNFNGKPNMNQDPAVNACIYPDNICGCDWMATEPSPDLPIDSEYNANNAWENGTGNKAQPIGASDCDCYGKQLDAVNVCGGQCEADINPPNGVCDDSEDQGCMNSAYCSYDLEHTFEVEGDCVDLLSDSCFDGSGNCVSKTIYGPADGCQEAECTACDCEPLTDANRDDNNNDVCDAIEVVGCTDETKCNFNFLANVPDPATCQEYDACNVCGGLTDVLPDGDCDCYGNKLDAVGVCGGSCPEDIDGDGLCDTVDKCTGLNDFIDNNGDTCVLADGNGCSNNRLDACGNCGSAGPVRIENVQCGCQDWNTDWCGCTETPPYMPIYPDPGMDCNGACLYGSVNGNCLQASEAIETVQPEVYSRNLSPSNKASVDQDVFAMEEWMANIDSLHSRMSKNLDDGSYSGASDTLTIEHVIIDRGLLVVSGSARLGGDNLIVPDPAQEPATDDVYFTQNDAGEWIPATVQQENSDGTFTEVQLEEVPSQYKDSVIINSNLYVGGRMRVAGTSFNDGGIKASSMDLSGDLRIGGDLDVVGRSGFGDRVVIHDSLAVEEVVIVGQNSVVMRKSGAVETDTLLARHDGIVNGNFYINQNASVGKNLTVNNVVTVVDSLRVPGSTVFDGSVEANQSFTANSSSTFTGSSAFTGSVHVESNSFRVGTSAAEDTNHSLVIDGSGSNQPNGISIKVAGAGDPGPIPWAGNVAATANQVSSANSFITFVNHADETIGSIHAQTPSEATSLDEYVNTLFSLGVDVKSTAIDAADQIRTAARLAVKSAIDVAAGVAGVIPGAGLTDSDVAEGVAWGASAGKSAIETGIEVAAAVSSTQAAVEAVQALEEYTSYYWGNSNVIYSSGGADYAEYLERVDTREVLSPGQIVGVKSGKVSKNTNDADHLLVVSTNPVVLGNMPSTDRQSDFDKIAFMGQVPIQILGSIKEGDFIVPSGEYDGLGIAVPKDQILLDQIPLIVGVAWEDGDNEFINYVNCSIGLSNNAQKLLIQGLNSKLEAMQLSWQLELSNQVEAMKLEMGVRSLSKAKRRRLDKKQRKNNLEFEEINLLKKPVTPTKDETFYAMDQTSAMSEDTQVTDAYPPLSFYEGELDKYMADYIAEASIIGPDEAQVAIEALTTDFTRVGDVFKDASKSGAENMNQLMNDLGYAQVPAEFEEAFSNITLSIIKIMSHPDNLEKGYQKTQVEFITSMRSMDIPNSVVNKFILSNQEKEKLFDDTRQAIIDHLFDTHPYMRQYYFE